MTSTSDLPIGQIELTVRAVLSAVTVSGELVQGLLKGADLSVDLRELTLCAVSIRLDIANYLGPTASPLVPFRRAVLLLSL